jgi:hypothetical protein
MKNGTNVRLILIALLRPRTMMKSCTAITAALFLVGCLSGCLGGSPDDYHYTVDDADGSVSDEGIDDPLFNLTLEDRSEVNMKFSDLTIVLKQDGVSYPCEAEGAGGNCTITQHGGDDDAYWEMGETLTVSENGVNICGGVCILTFTLEGPEGSLTTGPTVLTVR